MGVVSWRKRVGIAAGAAVLGLGLLLFVPAPTPDPPALVPHAFAWNADEAFASIRARFEEVRRAGCGAESAAMTATMAQLEASVSAIETRSAVGYDDVVLVALEAALFRAGAEAAACPDRVPQLLTVADRARSAIKRVARGWDLARRPVRDRLYRSLTGLRAAVEEALAQSPVDGDLPVARGIDEPCSGPSTTYRGVRICSGDMLLSRAAAPTSALIARGNDYPGVFSHVALVHVGEGGEVSIIEAHIERGVAVATIDEYLADAKLRILAVRVRADHPALARQPDLPNRAATAALEDARGRHIPYDFAMDYRDPSAMFCTEIATSPYAAAGLTLYEDLSTFTSPSLVGWLASLGVTQFETQAPADLELDPAVVVVAEWRAVDVLRTERIHDAVIDAMLEDAMPGEPLPYDTSRLPLARLAKAWSWVLNRFGEIGPVPEGMSATVALRADGLRARHAAAVRLLEERAAAFRAEHGYEAPYWELVRLASW